MTYDRYDLKQHYKYIDLDYIYELHIQCFVL